MAEHDSKPQNDPDVQRGYDEHQKQFQEQEAERERISRGGIPGEYEVKKSNEGTERQQGGD